MSIFSIGDYDIDYSKVECVGPYSNALGSYSVYLTSGKEIRISEKAVTREDCIKIWKKSKEK